MKKFLAIIMAAAITVSAGMTNAFAANTSASFKLSFTPTTLETPSQDPTAKALAPGEASMIMDFDGGSLTFRNKKALNPGAAGPVIAAAFAGAEAEMTFGGTLYTAKLNAQVLDSGVSGSSGNALTATFYPAGKLPTTLRSVSLSPAGAANSNGKLAFTASSVGIASQSYGAGGVHDDSDTNIDIRQVLYSDANGRAIPLVEDKKDLSGTGDGVRSGTDIYFLVNAPFDNDNYFKLKASKGKNSKNIDSIEIKSKYLNKELYKVYGGAQLSGGLTTGRHTFVKVKLKELYTDDEYKITYDLKVSLTNDGQKKYPKFKDSSVKAEDVTAIWLKNKVADGDGDYRVGEKGLMIKPLENDWNEIVWYNEQNDLARLKFFADSDVDAFYCKLSTKWNHEDYFSYFNDQDAYQFSFTGLPKLSATSRADLEIYSPFQDEDGRETVDPKGITIYQVVDGDLVDITDKWTYKENDDGYMAYTMRTRFLGTYIFCEKPVKQAVDNPADVLPPDAMDILPSGASPDAEQPSGGKQPANTGRYA